MPFAARTAGWDFIQTETLPRIPMKTMILAAFAAISLGVGAAYAQGVPAGYQGAPHYGTQSSANG
jgi:hypothetical protein